MALCSIVLVLVVELLAIELQNPRCEGKKMLVMDIDYTLFNHRSTAENPLELMQTHHHEFISAVYTEYDIMIWSATNMKWVEMKVGQLGVLNLPNYKITALLNHLAIITVQSDAHGVFDCKPLGLIWAHFPEFYSPKNTIMFDDLRRNCDEPSKRCDHKAIPKGPCKIEAMIRNL